MRKNRLYILLLLLFHLFIIVLNGYSQGKLIINGSVNLFLEDSQVCEIVLTEKSENKSFLTDAKGNFSIELNLNKNYTLSIRKKGFYKKEAFFRTKVPSTLINEEFTHKYHAVLYPVFEEINLIKYPQNSLIIRFFGDKKSGYFSSEMSSFNTQKTADENLSTAIVKLKREHAFSQKQKIEKEINSLSDEALELLQNKYKDISTHKANEILAEAYKKSNQIKEHAREDAEFEYNLILASAQKNITSDVPSDLSYSEDEENEELIKEHNTNNTPKITTLTDLNAQKKKIEELSGKKNLSNSEIIELTHAEINFKRSQIERAKYLLQIQKLKVRTHEDSMLIKQRENEILLAEKEINEKEQTIDDAKRRIEVQKYKIQNQKLILNSIIVFIVILLVIGYILWKSYSEKKKINKQLEQKNAIISEKNKEITDSILYAKGIQNALLPPANIYNKHFNDAFLYYQPKDIVSGDFYWFEKIEDNLLFSVIDCTGHGVPGAFMSIIGLNSLARLVNELLLKNPAEILNKLSKIVNDTLNKSNEVSLRDGMDMALCSFSYKDNYLNYSGAHNPVYICSTDKLKQDKQNNAIIPIAEHKDFHLYEIKGDKRSVGYSENIIEFNVQHIQLKEDDRIYIFSDGYPDQFGGPRNKRLKYKNFKVLLLEAQQYADMQKQKEFIKNYHAEWKGNLEQIDDVCVLGVKI